MQQPSLRDRMKAVIALDRAEVAAEDARQDFAGAARRGLPLRGYGIAYEVALRGLAGARIALDKVTRARDSR